MMEAPGPPSTKHLCERFLKFCEYLKQALAHDLSLAGEVLERRRAALTSREATPFYPPIGYISLPYTRVKIEGGKILYEPTTEFVVSRDVAFREPDQMLRISRRLFGPDAERAGAIATLSVMRLKGLEFMIQEVQKFMMVLNTFCTVRERLREDRGKGSAVVHPLPIFFHVCFVLIIHVFTLSMTSYIFKSLKYSEI